MYVLMYVYIYSSKPLDVVQPLYFGRKLLSSCIYVDIYVCICAYIYVYLYVYVCIYIYIYDHLICHNIDYFHVSIVDMIQVGNNTEFQLDELLS